MALKLAGVTGCAVLLKPYVSSRLSAWLAAWIVLTFATNLAMLLASAFAALTMWFIWLWLGALGAIAVATRRDLYSAVGGSKLFLPAIPILVVVGVVAVRAFIFADFTWDAQTYGLARLGLWMNYDSILVHMPTNQINVFCNEWNGELLALVYGLASGSIQGLMFGGVEALLVTCLAAVFLARGLGSSIGWASLVGGVVGSTPVVLGMAGMLKGDLLACGALLLAAGWAVSIARGQWLSFAMMLAAGALAVGSKVTVAFGMIAICGFGAFMALRVLSARQICAALGTGGALSLIFLSRNAINWIVYGNPLIRVRGEDPVPGLDTLVAGLGYVGPMLTQSSVYRAGEPVYGWLLSAGMGFTFILAVAVAVSRWLRGDTWHPASFILILGAAGAVLATAYVLPIHPWSFRYFAPVVLVASVALMAVHQARTSLRRVALVVTTGVIVWQTTYLGWAGEINGNGSLSWAVQLLPTISPRDRTLISNPPLKDAYAVDKYAFDGDTEKTFVVLAEFNRPIAMFLGSRAQNRLILTSTTDELMREVARANPDYAVMTKASGGVPTRPELGNYQVEVDNEMVTLWRRQNR